MDAVHYLRERMDAWLTWSGATDRIEFACSRHELRGAARALREAGLLTVGNVRMLLDEYDARLGDAGHFQQAPPSWGHRLPHMLVGRDRLPVRPRVPGRLERVITVPQPADATPVGAPLVGSLLEVATDLVVFHYRTGGEPWVHREHGRLRRDASDDRGSDYTLVGSGAFSGRTGTLGVVEFAGRLPPEAARCWCAPPTRTGRPRACSSTCDPFCIGSCRDAGDTSVDEQIAGAPLRGLLVEARPASSVPTPLESTRETEQGHAHAARTDSSSGVIDTARKRVASQQALIGSALAVVARPTQDEILVGWTLQARKVGDVAETPRLVRLRRHAAPRRWVRR